MGIRKIIKSLTWEKKMFLRMLGLVTLPLMVMGIVSFHIYLKGETAKKQMALDSYSDQVAREYENILSSLKEYYIEAGNGEDIRWLVRQKEPPFSFFSDLKQAQRILEGNYFMAKYISTYEFINVNYGWVFNNYGIFPFEQMKNKEETMKFLEEQEKVPLSVYWSDGKDSSMPMIGNMRVSNTVDTSGFRLVVKKEKGIDGISWMITVKLDESKLKEMARSYKSLGYDVTILSRGKVLLDTNPEMTKMYLENKPQALKTYNISERNADITGLTYLVGYNAGTVKKDAFAFILASFAVLAGFALILAAVRLTVLAFAKPLHSLEKYVDDQDSRIKMLLVSNLIEGMANEKSIEEGLKKPGIAPRGAYRLIAIKGKAEDTDYPAVLSGVPEELKKDIFISPVCYQDKMVFIVGSDGDGDLDQKTALLYKGLKDYMKNTYGMAIASGISQPFHQLRHVKRAYSECTEALYNKTNQTDADNSSLVLFDDFLLKDPAENVYDMIMENELISSVISGKEEEAACLLELVIDRMEQKNVVGIERNFYWTRLVTALFNIPVSENIPLSEVFDSSQYNVLSSVTSIYDKKEAVEAVTRDIIRPIITALSKEKQKEREPEIVKSVTALIKESKGNMTLNECADRLSYHPNYLSKVLKKEKGVTFTDMANEEKLKQARYMLLTTEYSVAEISEKLMYNNVQNFIRFFKNHVGLTPAAFRKEHRK